MVGGRSSPPTLSFTADVALFAATPILSATAGAWSITVCLAVSTLVWTESLDHSWVARPLICS